MAKNIRLAVLVSGGGTTLKNILDRIEQGQLDARVELVLSSDPKAYALQRAERAGLESVVVNRKKHPDTESFSQEITNHLDRCRPDLVCMAGFLHFYKIPEQYRWKVINIHPALLPRHGGEGYYKHHVHEAVLESGDEVSGCTVHFATNRGYDRGPVILQREVPVQSGDTVETLSERVFEAECEVYPEVIQMFAEDRIHVEDGEVRVEE